MIVRPRLLVFLPLAIFVLMAVLLGVGLTIYSTRVPSPFIDRELPAFGLPAVTDPQRRVRPADFRGQMWLLNV